MFCLWHVEDCSLWYWSICYIFLLTPLTIPTPHLARKGVRLLVLLEVWLFLFWVWGLGEEFSCFITSAVEDLWVKAVLYREKAKHFFSLIFCIQHAAYRAEKSRWTDKAHDRLIGDGTVWQKIAAWFDKTSNCENHLIGRESCRISTFHARFFEHYIDPELFSFYRHCHFLTCCICPGKAKVV